MMNRSEALGLVKEKINNKNLVKHMLATEAVMRALAGRFGENEEKWGLTGLLHDLDYTETVEDFQNHGKITAGLLAGRVDEDIIYAIKAHPGHVERISKLDKALYAVDPVTGLIVAAALINPEKKLSSITAQSVLNRFGEKRFAAGANREQIKTCSEVGLSLEEFIEIGLKAMQGIAFELGL